MSKLRDTGDDDILNGWKQIGMYLKCSAKTAQRWAGTDDLPILRPVSRSKPPVFASKRALDAWLKGGVEHVVLTDRRLIAFDRKRHILWSHEFSYSLRDSGSDELGWHLQIVDLVGNGERGVLFAARFVSSSVADTLLYFSSCGDIAWQLEADPPLRDRNGDPFDRAWVYKHVVVTQSTNGCTVWAALGNDAGWAGCVLRIDPHGSAVVHFANTGYVEWLCPVALEAGGFMVVCGENNDFDQAFGALLKTDDPSACSVPGKRLVYRFANAPTGRPRNYILFPRTELILARQRPYGHATRIVQHLDGLIVQVETGVDGAHFRYHFSKSFEPRYVFPSGNHEFAHRALEERGVITHSWLNCPEMQAPLSLRVWELDSGWYDRPIHWRDNPWKEIQCDDQ